MDSSHSDRHGAAAEPAVSAVDGGVGVHLSAIGDVSCACDSTSGSKLRDVSEKSSWRVTACARCLRGSGVLSAT
eukprot:943831-Pleurochrysis_carterae.AAC.1